jgi:hypothetical protein
LSPSSAELETFILGTFGATIIGVTQSNKVRHETEATIWIIYDRVTFCKYMLQILSSSKGIFFQW